MLGDFFSTTRGRIAAIGAAIGAALSFKPRKPKAVVGGAVSGAVIGALAHLAAPERAESALARVGLSPAAAAPAKNTTAKAARA